MGTTAVSSSGFPRPLCHPERQREAALSEAEGDLYFLFSPCAVIPKIRRSSAGERACLSEVEGDLARSSPVLRLAAGSGPSPANLLTISDRPFGSIPLWTATCYDSDAYLEASVKTLTFCLALTVMSCTLAFGQTYKVLWSFDNANGAAPLGNLVSDSAGNLYGTTQYGGSGIACNSGCGTVFELSPSSDGTWSETVLYNFCSDFENSLCLDGQLPVAGLVFDNAGNLYGTTTYGGAGSCGYRCGTVFELSPPLSGGAWTETVLYSFCAGSNNKCQDGAEPKSQLIFDASGNLYGTTSTGGTGNGGYGTAFELSPGVEGWTHLTLYNFCSSGHARICPDGAQPLAAVTFDKAGNLYGTTMLGGSKNSQGTGTVFELSPGSNGWTHTIVLAFSPTGNGLGFPLGAVSFDPQGNLYSTGSLGNPGGGVFQLQLKTHTERKFMFNITNGSGPGSGVLVAGKSAAIYGTTVGGGSEQGGVVYKIVSSGRETVLYDFCQQANCADGQFPYASLIEDGAGNLYGTTQLGGAFNQGVVFEVTP